MQRFVQWANRLCDDVDGVRSHQEPDNLLVLFTMASAKNWNLKSDIHGTVYSLKFTTSPLADRRVVVVVKPFCCFSTLNHLEQPKYNGWQTWIFGSSRSLRIV